MSKIKRDKKVFSWWNSKKYKIFADAEYFQLAVKFTL
jgi:hypothetical protein